MLAKRLQVFCLIAVVLLISHSQVGASGIIVSFSGIVVDDVLSLGIQNVIVRIFNGNPEFFSTQMLAETRTNSEGVFSCSQIQVDNNKSIYLTVQPEDEYYPTTLSNVVKIVEPGEYKLGTIVVKQRTVKIDINGEVIDDIKGNPIKGCNISLYNGNPDFKTTTKIASQNTKEDGTYHFSGIEIEKDSKLSIVVACEPIYEAKTLLDIANSTKSGEYKVYEDTMLLNAIVASKPGDITVGKITLKTNLIKASIKGKVTDDIYKTGVSDAVVRVYNNIEGNIFKELLYEFKTDENGNFVAADRYFPKNQKISIEIVPPNEFDRTYINDAATVSSKEEVPFMPITLRRNTIEINIGGTLFDASDGQSIQNGSMSIKQKDIELLKSPVDNKGKFVANLLKVKRGIPIALRFTAKGCFDAEQTITADQPGDYQINASIKRHTYSVSVDGYILDDISGNGIPGSAVQLTTGNKTVSIKTDSKGYFSYSELEIDTRISSVVKAKAEASSYDSKELSTSFTGKGNVGFGNISLFRNQFLSNITGRIIDSATKKGVPKATVVLILGGKAIITAQTDNNGNYVLKGASLPRNTDMDIKVTAATYDDLIKSGFIKLDRSGDKRLADLSITKTVYYSLKIRGVIVDSDSKTPIANATVSAIANGKSIATANTNNKGEYILNNSAVKKNSSITVVVNGPISSSYKYAQTTIFSLDKLDKPYDVQKGTSLLTKSVFSIVITGQCFEPIGQKYIKDVKVSVDIEGKTYSTLTNERGAYSLEVKGVKRGTKLLLVHALAGYRKVYRELIVNSPQTQSLGKIVVSLEANLLLTESNITVDNGYRYITGVIYNNSSYRYESLTVFFKLYDRSGALVGNTSDSILGLDVGERWRFKAIILDDKVVDYSLDGVSN